MQSLLRIAVAVNKVNSGNPADCLDEIKGLLAPLEETPCDLMIFPRLALCPASCGSLLGNPALLDDCDRALRELCAATVGLETTVLIGLPLAGHNGPISVTAVLHRGKVLGFVSDSEDQPLHYPETELLSSSTVFRCGPLRLCLLDCLPQELPMVAPAAVSAGCDLLVLPAYSPVWAGYTEQVCSMAQAVSQSLGCAVALVNGGIGDTSSPYLYNGFSSVYECGVPLHFAKAGYQSVVHFCDLDGDIIRSQRLPGKTVRPFAVLAGCKEKQGLLRSVSQNPFLPETGAEAYLEELFDFQVRSLVARIENTGLQKLIVGVSGGLDSTAALLVGVKALEVLELPPKNLIGITMPGFGTSGRTHFNALSLLNTLGATQMEISIQAAVQQHFEDIGHSGQKDTTYENAQARERTQILLDIANSKGGLVIGTGDLSEEALGFCTFAGDHIANYNVNVCITKTVLRSLVTHLATKLSPETAGILEDILDTPISPELLPLSEQGEVAQKSEDILGPYRLHDFFLYHFVRYQFRPSKLFAYACHAFASELAPAFIKEKLRIFFKRFCAGQFKRACAPDAASITEINLCGVNYYIPSDLDPSSLLRELEAL
ncbi:NAD(+) synthase [Oscillospiraceae bacterium MB08-C2-2]|nr:NAD(+) synthase [Oscillospiraceae bacterium MB08-C2-2]